MVQNRKLRRVTDLFVKGTTVDLSGDGTELVFVRKPNAFERGEAEMDGRAARQLRMATLEREGNDRASTIEMAAARLSDEDLLEGSLTQERNRAYLLAIDDVKTDEVWFERMEMLERTDQRIRDGAVLTEEEQVEFNTVNGEYMDAVNGFHEQRMADLRAERAGESHEDLVKAYVTVWIELEGVATFEEERWTTLMYFAVRDCVGKVPKGGSVADVDHTKCTHPRLLDTKKDVRELPDELRDMIEPVLREQMMTQAEAGNSAAPTSSSGSSGQHDAEEESQASTPKAG